LSFLDRAILSAGPDPSSVISERWWSGGGIYQSSTGITVTSDLAMQVSCCLLGGIIYGGTLSTLPLVLYRDLPPSAANPKGAKERAKDHYLWPVLRKRPNPWQTGQQWRELMTVFAVYWGRGMSEIRIVPQTGDIQLIPLHPDWIVSTEQVEGSMKLRFKVREPGRPERTLLQDEVFRLEGFAIHTFMPANILGLAREAIGLWIATQKFGALYFGQGATPSLWLQFPNGITDLAYNRLKEQAEANYSGLNNAHKVRIVQEGATVKETSHNAKDAQLIEATDAQVHDWARIFHLPVDFFSPMASTATYASAEVRNQNAVDYSFRPFAVRWESCLQRDLFPDEDDIYVEHLFDGLLRGNSVDRANAQSVWVTNGILTRNEARLMENRPPLAGLDEPLTPLNMERTSGESSSPPASGPKRIAPAAPSKKKAARAKLHRRAYLIAKQTAERVVRKEMASVLTKAEKRGETPWAARVLEFYGEFSSFVSESLQLEPAVAKAYCERHADKLLAEGVAVMEAWPTVAVNELVALAELAVEESV
jgi:HK97 family phage portal protein